MNTNTVSRNFYTVSFLNLNFTQPATMLDQVMELMRHADDTTHRLNGQASRRLALESQVAALMGENFNLVNMLHRAARLAKRNQDIVQGILAKQMEPKGRGVHNSQHPESLKDKQEIKQRRGVTEQPLADYLASQGISFTTMDTEADIKAVLDILEKQRGRPSVPAAADFDSPHSPEFAENIIRMNETFVHNLNALKDTMTYPATPSLQSRVGGVVEQMKQAGFQVEFITSIEQLLNNYASSTATSSEKPADTQTADTMASIPMPQFNKEQCTGSTSTEFGPQAADLSGTINTVKAVGVDYAFTPTPGYEWLVEYGSGGSLIVKIRPSKADS